MKSWKVSSVWLAWLATLGAGVASAQDGAGGAGGGASGTGGAGAAEPGPESGPAVPFDDADSAPVLRDLAFGRVLGTRQYELVQSLGELPGVGLAPGFAATVRVLSHG